MQLVDDGDGYGDEVAGAELSAKTVAVGYSNRSQRGSSCAWCKLVKTPRDWVGALTGDLFFSRSNQRCGKGRTKNVRHTFAFVFNFCPFAYGRGRGQQWKDRGRHSAL